MKLTASVNGKSKSSSARDSAGKRSSYVMCIDNDGYAASLEVGKVYKTVPGETGVPKWIRVIDESGEDYLYPAKRFIPMTVPTKGRRAIAIASRL